MKRLSALKITALASALLAPPAAAAAQGTAGYGEDLAQVYGTYQAILARKEACDDGAPNLRGANQKSYAAWRARNAKIITELDDRLARMIRGASRDDKEYARNIGKYEGGILQQRQEARQALLAQSRGELDALCKSLPELLTSKDSDLETLYADELKSIRSRP